jgi:ComF family protein
MVNSRLDTLLEKLFPRQCLLCRQPSHNPQPLCHDCRTSLPLNHCACEQCALPLPTGAAPGALCESCLEGQRDFDRVIAPLVYGPGIRQLVSAWKYRRQTLLSPLLASLWLEHLTQLPACDLLLPVPLHWRRQLWRGFNQAALLGRALQRSHPALAGIPLLEGGLQRRQHTRHQAGLGAGAREANLAGSFRLRAEVNGLRVAVIDDVVTTGATAREVAAVLKDGGAASVQIWSLARTPAHPATLAGPASGLSAEYAAPQ